NRTDALLRDAQLSLFNTRSAPTVVPAKVAGPSTKPSSPPSELDAWKLASRPEPPKRPSPSSVMSLDPPRTKTPEPPKATRDRYAIEPPALAAPMKKPDEPKPLSAEPSLRQVKKDVVRVDPDGIASVEASPIPPATPSYRERDSRYDNPTPPSRAPARYENPSPMTTTRYEADDYRRDAIEPPRSNYAAAGRPAYRSPTPPRRDDGKYEVQPNDSYWIISERLYGAGAYYKALAQHNRGSSDGDDRLQPGSLILAPSLAELEKSYPDLCPKASRREAMQSQGQSRMSTVSTRGGYGGRVYTVVEGDTLFNIARYELGKASRWAEIYDLNRDVLGKDFNYLTPGTKLSLPNGDRPERTAQPPSGTYRR
ncbi:MAG: LysM peptidoglycan-binding domain-containing protein, partial [Thermoguttaceae bacterium]